jgi:molybdate transport system ATP-binding protein
MTLTASIRKRLSPGFTLEVTLTAAPGITIVFGQSGSGKTTLLRCLAGLVRPDGGRIAIGDRVFFDSDRTRNLPVSQRQIGYVFQQLALFPHMTVAQNLEYGLPHVSAADRRERIRTVAESFRIAHVLARKPAETSGGERQRTALARSLVTDPSLLLLDEPLSALDHLTQSRIIEDLRRWNAAHAIPILYVTHAQREVFALGERVIVLEAGRVLVAGTPHDVMELPSHEPVAQLAGFENFFDGVVVTCHRDAGTMRCRLVDTETEIEVPFMERKPGSPVRIAVRAGDILLATDEPKGVSARNVFAGHVSALRREGPIGIADVEAGVRFVVHLTPSAVEALGLARGQPVWLIIKTHSCRIVAA